MSALADPRRSRSSDLVEDLASRVAIGGVAGALRKVRHNLGMDVAFVTEFIGHSRCFRFVDAQRRRAPIAQGDIRPLDEGYCKKVADGRLPELIPDTALVPEAMAIPATRAVPIGSHLSVPIRLGDGRLYGMFCCFGFRADASLNGRDLAMMRTFAELIGAQIDADRQDKRNRDDKIQRIRSVLCSEQPSIHYQPVIRLSSMATMGAEALSRFDVEPPRTPDLWFAEAEEIGLKAQLELRAIRNAAAGFRGAWGRGRLHLGVNCSPQTIIEGGILAALEGVPADLMVLEITEHATVTNYGELLRALAPLRQRGIRIAVDDAGSGYASMRHILDIGPDFIKLDISLTRAIDADRTRRALAVALIEFGQQTDCTIVAEGVETAAELQTLRDLGVFAAQGYYLGRPAPIADFPCGPNPD
jgi:EAL domain-containing protein (putative c-di-GMP-specific phosphodiesterase class I)